MGFDIYKLGKNGEYSRRTLADNLPEEIFDKSKNGLPEKVEKFSLRKRTVYGINYFEHPEGIKLAQLWYSLTMMPKEVILIGGGKAPENKEDYSILDEESKKVRYFLSLSKDQNNPLHKYFEKKSSLNQLLTYRSLEETLENSKLLSQRLKIPVLFCPGQSSLDLFEGYKDRSRLYNEGINNL